MEFSIAERADVAQEAREASGPVAATRRRAPTISVATLLWRNDRHVPGFLDSLGRAAAVAGVGVELIVVQNGPDGDAASKALGAHPQAPLDVRLLVRAENLGFAGGMNEACREASGDLLVLANLDLVFDERFIAELVRLAPILTEPTGAALVAPSVRSPEGDADPATRPSPGGPDGEQGAARPGFVQRLRPAVAAPGRLVEVPAGNGCCMVVPRVVYERRVAVVGGVFDPEYHSFYEDVDLFWWARDEGVPVLFDPVLRVEHHKAGSFAGRFRFGDRAPDIRSSVMANYRLTVWKHARRPLDLIGWVAGELGYLVLSVRAGGARGVATYLVSWCQAVARARAIRRRRASLRERVTTGMPTSSGPAAVA
jgi:GT2 family glycosyltransferase